MKLRCGYNCINLTLPRNFRTCKLQTVLDRDIDKLRSIIDHNLTLLGDIIYYNLVHNIYLFRISPGIIPFVSHPAMLDILNRSDILKRDCVMTEFDRIKETVKSNNMRLSIHPGQYNVMNSLDSSTIKRTIVELKLQEGLLKMLGGDTMVLHIGGAFGDKDLSKKRFVDNCKNYLSEEVLTMLKIENDDKSYNCNDVLDVCKDLNIGWVYDYHHEWLNPSDNIQKVLREHEPSKYHICDGMNGKKVISHDNWVQASTMTSFVNQLEEVGISSADVMFESKMKDLSLIRVMQPLVDGYWKIKH